MAAGDRQAEDFVFSQTTVDDIVAAAGASRRTFFRYFESKRDLIAQPAASYAATLAEAIASCPGRAQRAFLISSQHCPGRLLVGSRDSSVPEVDLAAINQAFARCSLEFFVSAKRLDGSDLMESIGVWPGIANDTELNAVWEQIKADF